MADFQTIFQQALYDLFADFAENINFRQLTRAEWRSLCVGDERIILQQSLCALARLARDTATVADARQLFLAAFAVYPLQGQPLIELVELLLMSRPIAIEWTDVLIAAFDEKQSLPLPIPTQLLEAAREIMEMSSTTACEAVRQQCFASQLIRQGFGHLCPERFRKPHLRAQVLPVNAEIKAPAKMLKKLKAVKPVSATDGHNPDNCTS